jgi:hypothetical protein
MEPIWLPEYFSVTRTLNLLIERPVGVSKEGPDRLAGRNSAAAERRLVGGALQADHQAVQRTVGERRAHRRAECGRRANGTASDARARVNVDEFLGYLQTTDNFCHGRQHRAKPVMDAIRSSLQGNSDRFECYRAICARIGAETVARTPAHADCGARRIRTTAAGRHDRLNLSILRTLF